MRLNWDSHRPPYETAQVPPSLETEADSTKEAQCAKPGDPTRARRGALCLCPPRRFRESCTRLPRQTREPLRHPVLFPAVTADCHRLPDPDVPVYPTTPRSRPSPPAAG